MVSFLNDSLLVEPSPELQGARSKLQATLCIISAPEAVVGGRSHNDWVPPLFLLSIRQDDGLLKVLLV